MKMDKDLNYVKIQGLYICIDKNLFVLTWLLLCRTRPFNLHLPAHNRYLKLLSGKFIKILRVLYIICNLYSLQIFKYKRNYKLISVPYDGHILLNKSGGYKVFNLKENIVITQYEPNMQEENFTSIARNLESIADLDISPAIKAVDYQSKIIIEEYINLYKARGFHPISVYFFDEILPIWERNISIIPKRAVDVKGYILNQKSFLLNSMNRLKQDGNKDRIEGLQEFVKQVSSRIEFINNQTKIQLTYTHGDLHAWNILLDNESAILLDWDTLKERTLLYDLFYMLFHRLFGNETNNYSQFVSNLNKVINVSTMKLKSENKGIEPINHNKDLYRLLFYLEYVTFYIEKKINFCIEGNHTQNNINRLYKDISIFEEVEQNICNPLTHEKLVTNQ